MEPKNSGMTLIEVLAALAIIAIALMAVLQTTGMSTKQLTRVQEVATAHWVAKNAGTRMQLGLESNSLGQGAFQGVDTMLGRQYYWSAKTHPLSQSQILTIEVTVSARQGGPKLSEFVAYANMKRE
jgi:general secretion pathway protein I